METILALIGFIGLLGMIVLLVWDKVTPQTAFIGVSAVVGFILIGLDYVSTEILSGKSIAHILELSSESFGLKELGALVHRGVMSVAPTAALFIFSIMFFGILGAAGMFDRIINALIAKSGNNVYAITLMTVFIACIAHLDGSGASSFLIAIPALLPVYQRMGMRPGTLMLILAASMGVMNILPWGGPTLRVASILETDAVQLWKPLIPMQIVGLFLALLLAVIMAKVEIARGAGSRFATLHDVHEFDHKNTELKRDKMFIPNIVILLAVLVLLLTGGMPTYLPFMFGAVAALLLNYPQLSLQNRVINQTSGAAMMMATTLLAAGVLIGVFDKSGIMKLMAHLILDLMPEGIGSYLLVFIGLSAVPMALIFCTDSYFYGMLPIMAGIGSALGIDVTAIGMVMIVGRNCAAFVSPVVPATLLGCGLSGVSIKDHIKTSFFPLWGLSALCLVAGVLLGIIPL